MRTHLLHHEPPGQRVAECGAVEDLQITERMSFTIDPQDIECEGCRVVSILRAHLPIELPDEGRVLCMCSQTFDGPVVHRQHVAALITSRPLRTGGVVMCEPYTIRG